MKLSALSGKICDPDIDIVGLSADSRAIKPGFLFAALKGELSDGANYIPKAVQAGAKAVLVRDSFHHKDLPKSIALIHDKEPRRALSQMCARFYCEQPEFIAGITGTNGKTSTAQLASQIWALLGEKGGSLGTLGAQVSVSDGEHLHIDIGHTTPDPVILHDALQRSKQAGCEHMAMEVSSHGLSQYRCDGLRFSAAAFTNITQDHLDYHKDFAHYFAAKMRLFHELLGEDAPVIINRDGAGSDDVIASLEKQKVNIITTGRKGHDLILKRVSPIANGLDVCICVNGEDFELTLALVGGFQAENVLLACAIVMQSGFSARQIMDVLPKVRGVAGRMMYVASQNEAAIYVDYAHTPDAVKVALQAVRPHVEGRLIAIIGAGGDRDRTKRPLMGQAAQKHSDIVIIADDNPRSENPANIREEILKGAPSALNIGERARAIEAGIDMLISGDVLMILGKGHETGQTIGTVTHPFDDAKFVLGLTGNGEKK